MAQPTLARNPITVLTKHAEVPRSRADMSGASVYEVDPLQDPRWERLMARHARSSVFHSANWLRALHRAYGYEAFAISANHPDEELDNALAFCRVESRITGRRLVSLPFSDHCDPLVGGAEEFELLLTHTRGLAEAAKEDYIEIRPVALESLD